jgi:hypothetical protein
VKKGWKTGAINQLNAWHFFRQKAAVIAPRYDLAVLNLRETCKRQMTSFQQERVVYQTLPQRKAGA